MTFEHSPDQTVVDQPSASEITATETESAAKAGVPSFKSLFASAASAAGKAQPRHRSGNNFLYNERIGPAPRGSRRSMGKR